MYRNAFQLAGGEIASWLDCAAKAPPLDSFIRGALSSLIPLCNAMSEDMLPPEDDRMTLDSVTIGRYDSGYIEFIRKGGTLNYAAWLRYVQELSVLETKAQSENEELWTSEDARRFNDLGFYLLAAEF